MVVTVEGTGDRKRKTGEEEGGRKGGEERGKRIGKREGSGPRPEPS